MAVVKEVKKDCPKGAIVVTESTVRYGTMHTFVRTVAEENGFKIGEDLILVLSPERIIAGGV